MPPSVQTFFMILRRQHCVTGDRRTVVDATAMPCYYDFANIAANGRASNTTRIAAIFASFT
jgi:hypothetical protein